MSATVAQMTKDEFREMLDAVVEQKLLELLGDPDEGLEMRKAVRDKSLRQRETVASGERDVPFEDIAMSLTCSEGT